MRNYYRTLSVLLLIMIFILCTSTGVFSQLANTGLQVNNGTTLNQVSDTTIVTPNGESTNNIDQPITDPPNTPPDNQSTETDTEGTQLPSEGSSNDTQSPEDISSDNPLALPENPPVLPTVPSPFVPPVKESPTNIPRLAPMFEALNSNSLVSNDYLEIAVGSDGRFTLGTTGGNPDAPNDDYKKLLYGHPSPSTSFTTIKVDGVDNVFSTMNSIPSSNAIVSTQEINNLSLKQTLTLLNNPYTGQSDTVQIKYTVSNNDTEKHTVGTRIMMDTMLGDNDGAPFRLPEVGNVINELELTGNNIPEYWQAFDSLENPNVVSVGTFYRSLSERPDKVQFAYWGDIVDTTWGYTIDPNKPVTSDSAVAMYWNEDELSPGQSREYVTYYGLGTFAIQDLRPPLALRIQAPQELLANENSDGYIPNPYTLVAYVWNNGDGIATNSKLNLELPAGLTLISGSQEVALGDLAPGEEQSVTWQIQAESQSSETTLSYSIKASADNSEDKTLPLTIVLPAVQTLSLSRQAGIEYEQTTSPPTLVIRPAIYRVNVEPIDAHTGKYRFTITGLRCDRLATPFFFWKAEEGLFTNVSDDVKTVDFTVDPGTSGETITIYAYIGDNLGYVGFYKIRVPGRN